MSNPGAFSVNILCILVVPAPKPAAHGHFITMSGTFVDRIDPFAKRSLKKKTKKSQGSSRYRNSQDVELQALPLLKVKPVVANLFTIEDNFQFWK